MNISTTEKYGKVFGQPSFGNWNTGPIKNSSTALLKKPISKNDMELLNEAISKKGLTGELAEEIIKIAKKNS